MNPETPDRVDIETERMLIEIDWINRKHNGGGLAFGPDGRLYVGMRGSATEAAFTAPRTSKSRPS